MKFRVIPISLREANDFVSLHHRHNGPVRGHRFSIGAEFGDQMVGIAIVGRPVARMLDDGVTAEVTRLCVCPDAPKNTCSFLYSRAWRAWQALGGAKLVTYTLTTESGSSLRGSGWKIVGQTKPGEWNRKSRPRRHQEIYGQEKFRWEVSR